MSSPPQTVDNEKTAKRRRTRKRIIGFCGIPIPKDVRETGILELSWGGIKVEVPLSSAVSFNPRYRYVCAEWSIPVEKGETALYPVKKVEGEELDHDIDKALKENCVVVGKDENEWLCTLPFFKNLYEKLKEQFGIK